jgi:hypothetical protein
MFWPFVASMDRRNRTCAFPLWRRAPDREPALRNEAEPDGGSALHFATNELPHTKQIVAEFGVERQFSLRPGNLMKDHLGDSEFDIVVLDNICHGRSAAPVRMPGRRSLRMPSSCKLHATYN